MEPPKISYYKEISSMMFGFGDSHEPNPDTVRLVESIVLKQLRAIVQEAFKYSDGKNMKGKELVFLMRHNKQKMRRFVKYLLNKRNNALLHQLHENIVDIDCNQQPKGELMEFIERIDETGEFTDLSEFDEVKYERQLRADRISQALDEQKYLEFCKARCASFNSRGNMQGSWDKLWLWIDPKKEVNFKPDALEVLAYYAYQTVAEITDYALLVRMDGKCGTDPLKHLPGSYYTATMFNGEHRFDGIKPDYSKTHGGQPSISVNEIKEAMRRVHSPQAGVFNGEHRFEGTKPDYSKVHSSQPPISVNEIKEVMRRVQSPQTGVFNGEHRFDGTKPDYTKVHTSQPPISVNEIKEAMRRVYSPQAGLLNFGGRLPETHYLFAL